MSYPTVSPKYFMNNKAGLTCEERQLAQSYLEEEKPRSENRKSKERKTSAMLLQLST